MDECRSCGSPHIVLVGNNKIRCRVCYAEWRVRC